ncbi:nuclear transport factor 2 family protein [Duganella radicis]|uniref:Tetratricopeptide repeat protein n=1 Tax=Duganella radicis TaxID=551988 RepID=A0A6L6PQ87_9BURK|nr:tetratricopeptide repeat protein [Duganella radicis]MTV41072.1 tetratricopeptide repeat protein [Duganella radicis]
MRKFAGLNKVVPAALAAVVLCAPVRAVEISDVSALLRARQYAAALAQSDEYLAARPDDAQMRFLKGLALAGLGRRAEAIADFTQLTADYPAMPESYNNLAVLQAADGQYDKARMALEGAVKANPSYARGHENLADMYLRLASQSYAQALKLEPNNGAARAKQALLLPALDYRGEAAPAAPGQEAEVVAVLQDWARAWSARDVAAYLAFYAADFHTPGNIPRASWEAERSARLRGAAAIHVTLRAPEVVLDGARATAKFDQSYRSDRISSNDRKTLLLEKRDGKWQILREDSRK